MNKICALSVKFILATMLLLLEHTAIAQDEKVTVSLIHIGEDGIGKQFAFAIREAIRGSNGFRLTQPEESGLQIRLITIDPEEKTQSNWTVATSVITMRNFIPIDEKEPQTWYPIYMTASVLTVGQSKTNEQARAIIATLDSQLDRYRRDLKKYSK